ncbi:cysteine-rich secretory protein 2-like [Schistocerca americana]|uniref:cysteine-rich secretory protein 2-like n=1 Tax=Schistocerca americana TaxID=7009 RepID=UPI001F4F3A21|nr:cysteine-rich secretory protein 2-like [Schistocerca americana]
MAACPGAAGPRARCLLRLLVLAALTLVLFSDADAWRTDTRPRVYGNKIPTRALVTTGKKVQRKILLYHNFFRTKVSPPASNMLKMTWHKGAARAAQRWAERCLMLTHDDMQGRWVNNYGSCGQNIFISTQQVPWYFAIKMWFAERDNFTYGSRRNDLHAVGHYTQMVWASTHKVGCGFTRCGSRGRTYYSYICNYCPMGNMMEKLGTPYEWGRACDRCPGHCRLGKLCTNACPSADLWGNCAELNSTHHHWLCDRSTAHGRDRHRFCRATCGCKGKIYG